MGGTLDLSGLLGTLRSQFRLVDHPDLRVDWLVLDRRVDIFGPVVCAARAPSRPGSTASFRASLPEPIHQSTRERREWRIGPVGT